MTIKETFEQMEEPERTEAIQNCELKLNDKCYTSLSTLLVSSFKWNLTKQKHIYWKKIYLKYLKK